MTQPIKASSWALYKRLAGYLRHDWKVFSVSIIAMVIAAMIGLATAERTTEYAVLRALGFEPAQVLIMHFLHIAKRRL